VFATTTTGQAFFGCQIDWERRGGGKQLIAIDCSSQFSRDGRGASLAVRALAPKNYFLLFLPVSLFDSQSRPS